MSQKTTMYGLTKPDENENYDIGVSNGNIDLIDDALKHKCRIGTGIPNAVGDDHEGDLFYNVDSKTLYGFTRAEGWIEISPSVAAEIEWGDLKGDIIKQADLIKYITDGIKGEADERQKTDEWLRTDLTAEAAVRATADANIEVLIDTKQNKLTPGSGISIVDDVISATGGGGGGIALPPETTSAVDATTRSSKIVWKPSTVISMEDIQGKCPKLEFENEGKIEFEGLNISVFESSAYDSDPSDGVYLSRKMEVPDLGRTFEDNVSLTSNRLYLKSTTIPGGKTSVLSLSPQSLNVHSDADNSGYIYQLTPIQGSKTQILTPEFIHNGEGVTITQVPDGPGIIISAPGGGGGGAVWGGITGDISQQSDLIGYIGGEIGKEAASRRDGVAKLTGMIDETTASLNTEVLTREKDDMVIRGSLEDEIVARQQSETEIQESIQGMRDNISSLNNDVNLINQDLADVHEQLGTKQKVIGVGTELPTEGMQEGDIFFVYTE